MIPGVKSSILYENRYCNENEYDISVFVVNIGSGKKENFTLSCSDLKITVKRKLISAHKISRKNILICSDVYLISRHCFKTFDMYYKNSSNTRKLKLLNKQLSNFSVCSFMSSVYVISEVYIDVKCSEEC